MASIDPTTMCAVYFFCLKNNGYFIWKSKSDQLVLILICVYILIPKILMLLTGWSNRPPIPHPLSTQTLDHSSCVWEFEDQRTSPLPAEDSLRYSDKSTMFAINNVILLYFNID